MNIILGEDLEELNHILEKIENLDASFYVIPLNLETLIFCNKNNINFLNPIHFIKNNFHEKALISSDKLLENLNYGTIEPESLRKDYKNYIRKKYNQFYFSYFLINEIIKSKDIKNIYVSGWESFPNDRLRSNKRYYMTSIANEYFKDKVKIVNATIDKKENIPDSCYSYTLSSLKETKRKKVLITSRGYNTYRLILVCILLGHSVNVISENKVNFISRFFFSFLGVNFLNFKKQTINKIIDFKSKNINFVFENIDFSNLLNISKKNYELKQSDTYFKSLCVKKLLEKEKIDLLISVIARGYQGSAVDFAKKLNIKTLGITHGTISKSFTKIDKIYKKIISEAVFTKNYNFFPLQTKISFDAVDTHSFPQPNLKTGNLIFAENLFKLGKKNKILYAVTSKNFDQMLFHGVELYFEFYKNLEILNNLAKSAGLKILVNLHPSVNSYSLQNLKGSFINLSFTKKKISSCLKDVFVTISFSSTVIEDSICSNVPIILFDNWKRYKHCESENKFFTELRPIYYVNSINDLKLCIKSIKNEKIDFSNIKYGGNCFTNIYSLLRKII